MNRSQYAGFWRRFFALIVDYNIVIFALFPFLLLAGLALPDSVHVTTPYDLFTEKEILETTFSEKTYNNGSVAAVETRIAKQTVLGKWVNHYEVEKKSLGTKTTTEVTLIDPDTGEPLERYETDSLIFWVLFFYWVWMESSRHKATFGKKLFGIIVEGEDGHRLSFAQSLGRNAGKILSAFIFCIGFMMAGWTDNKQGLHDKLAKCYVLKRRPKRLEPPKL